MSRPDKSRRVDAAKVSGLPLQNDKNVHVPRPTGAAYQGDLAATIRLVIEATLGARLDAIVQSIRTTPVANDGASDDKALAYRLPTVLRLVDVSKSTWYSWSNPNSPSYDPTLPRAIKLGNHTRSPSVWRVDEIRAWLEARAHTSRSRAK